MIAVPRHRAGPQAIPRPPGHRPGRPAPWVDLGAEERSSVPLARVAAALARPDRPGPVAAVGPEVAGAATAPAAVLVPLFEEAGQARVLLTVRSSHLRAHQGEVAFPGGKLDAGETIVEAAFREAREEVGLDPAGAAVLGRLTAMATVSSNTFMTPVVAILPGRPATDPAPDEVARVFDVALAELLADGVFAEELWSVPGRTGSDGRPGTEFPVWFFAAAGETIWGATARVLTELLCLVLGLPGPGSGPTRRIP